MTGSFKELKVYQFAFEAAKIIFVISKGFPKEETYSLIDQIRRSSRSVCANIGEGYRKRLYPKHFTSKMIDADGEATETTIWLDFALEFAYISTEDHDTLQKKYEEIGRMLNSMANNPESFSLKQLLTNFTFTEVGWCNCYCHSPLLLFYRLCYYRMNYQETLDYLYTQLPMFTRVGTSAFKADLTNTIALCGLLDNPQHKFKSMHVGGTNGKGSTSHMLAAVLQTAGYKTGLYTSPHLRDFRERIRIDGEMIAEQDVVNFVAEYQADFEKIQPSFFEMTVALAFDHFAKNKVDIAVVEVGLGGRLDSTNVITPLLSIITNIGWDHMNLLGDTLPLIAGEKAGIIKPSIPVIIGEYQPVVARVFEQKAESEKSPLTFASERWDVESSPKTDNYVNIKATPKQASDSRGLMSEVRPQTSDPEHLNPDLTPPTTDNRQPTTEYQLDLTGSYQLKNVKTVLTAVEELRKQGFNITDTQVQTALKNVQSITGLQGRWQTLNANPLTICDTGHNPEGIREVLKNIASVNYKHLHFVMGVVNDKDISKILQMLPQDATYYFCRPDIPRGLDADQLKTQAMAAGLRGEVYPTVKLALSAAQSAAQNGDLVFVGGSTFVVAEVV